MNQESDTILNAQKKIKKYLKTLFYGVFISILWFQSFMYFEVSSSIEDIKQRSTVMYSAKGLSLPDKDEVIRISGSFAEKNICSLFFSLPLGFSFGILAWIYFFMLGRFNFAKGIFPASVFFAVSFTLYGGTGAVLSRQLMLFFFIFFYNLLNPLSTLPDFSHEETAKIKRTILSVMIMMLLIISVSFYFKMNHYIFIRDFLKNSTPLEPFIDAYYKYTLYPAYMIKHTSERFPSLINGISLVNRGLKAKHIFETDSDMADFKVLNSQTGHLIINCRNIKQPVLIEDKADVKEFMAVLNRFDVYEKGVLSLNSLLSICVRTLFPLSIFVLIITVCTYFLMNMVHYKVYSVIAVLLIFAVTYCYEAENTKVHDALKKEKFMVDCIVFCTVNNELSLKDYNESKEWLKNNFQILKRPAKIWVYKNALRLKDNYFEIEAVNMLQSNDYQIVYKSAEYLAVVGSGNAGNILRKALKINQWWYTKSYILNALLSNREEINCETN